MYSSVCTNKSGGLYSGGRPCSGGGHMDSGGGVLSAAWSEVRSI